MILDFIHFMLPWVMAALSLIGAFTVICWFVVVSVVFFSEFREIADARRRRRDRT